MYKPGVFDIGARFRTAYGVVPVSVTNDRSIPGSQYVPAIGVEVYEGLDEAQSFEDISIYGNGHDLQFRSGMVSKSGSLGNVFAPPPITGFRRAKKLVITNVDGTDSEVVERWNNGVWELNIQGLLVDMENHRFPKDKLTTLNEIFEVGATFDVTGDWFEALNIESIYILEFIPAGVQGFMDTIQYNLLARSIKPVEFFINGEQ